MTLKKKPDEKEETIEEIVAQMGADMIAKDPLISDKTEAVPPVAAAPDPWAILDRMTKALEGLSARPASDSSNQAIVVLTEAVQRLAEASIKGSQLVVDESKKAFRPSNQIIPEVSVFNRRGREPGEMGDAKLHAATIKPPLKCLMMIPWVAEWESLTREEVQLLNLLEEGAYVIKRADRSKVPLTVQIRYAADNKTPSALFINHETAFNQDNFRNMPPLSDMLRDMLKQHDRPIAQRAAAVLTDEEEEALIEAGELTVTV